MAIVKNFWLRDNTQKLGGAVIYQAKGQTLMRQLAPAISNPRTDAQMEQRVKLANLVAFYRASAKWMRGAFETKPENQSDYNAFVSANAANNKVCLTKSQVEAGNGIVAPYQVTRGSLGEIVQTQTAGQIETNLYLGNFSVAAETTVAELTAALMANNNGLQEGDQLSFIQYIQNTSTTGSYTITCRAYEMLLSLSDVRLVSSFLPTDIVYESGSEENNLCCATDDFTGGVAFVLSRTTSARLLVSTSYVTLTANNTVYAVMTTNSQKQAAINSYGEATTVFLDSTLADTANSSVATEARILSLTINGTTYGTTDPIPYVINTSTPIIVTLSAPVTVLPDATLQITRNNGTAGIEAEATVTAPSTGTIIPYTVSVGGTLPQSETVHVEIELSDNSTISADFKTDGGNGEGLG